MRIFWSFMSLLILAMLVVIMLPPQTLEELGQSLEVAFEQAPPDADVLPPIDAAPPLEVEANEMENAGPVIAATERSMHAEPAAKVKPAESVSPTAAISSNEVDSSGDAGAMPPESAAQVEQAGDTEPSKSSAKPPVNTDAPATSTTEEVVPPAEPAVMVSTKPAETTPPATMKETAAPPVDEATSKADGSGAPKIEAKTPDAPSGEGTAEKIAAKPVERAADKAATNTPPATINATAPNEAPTKAAAAEKSTETADAPATTDAAKASGSKAAPPKPAAQKPAATDDDRFEIKGSGTKDDPYLLTWELMTSAYETYRPREHKDDMPARIQKLHDKYVRITGYLAFPMMSGDVDEALVMLNQWDGCCVGVPPTPYDSIEVKLVRSMEAVSGPFTPFGTVEGKLRIDPYLVNGWLVGLYIVENATVDVM